MTGMPLKIFFSGIGGSGVSAIANFMADKGCIIVGSDRSFDHNPRHPLCACLKRKGIRIVRQDGKGIDGSFDFAVFSTAVEPDQQEFVRAKALGIPMKTRPEYLAEIVKQYKTVAVAGTSGKSTTSGMLAFLMDGLGLHPNFIGGGRVRQFKTALNPGNSLSGVSDILVIEACESDGSIVQYKPWQSIILNLALDHFTVDQTAKLFKDLVKNTANGVYVNADDDNLKGVAGNTAVTFSIDSPSDFRPDILSHRPFGTEFSLRGITFRLSLPGKHNLYNALACLTVLTEMNIPLADIAEVMGEFNGIERRFDVHFNNGSVLVIDDYAHSPHKISALIQTMKTIKDRLHFIFQPHGFGPTRLMKDEYIEVFRRNLRDSDRLILLPIFYAGGTANRDISSEELAEQIRKGGKSVEVVEGRETILEHLDRKGSYVVFGARDETLADLAEDIARQLAKLNE